MAISRAQLMKELEPGLNALFGMEYDRYDNEHAEIFDTENSDRAFEEEVMLAGFGQAPTKGEGAAVSFDTANEAFTARYTHETIALAFAITEEAVEDNLYDRLSSRYTRALARSMANTKQVKAASILNNAFDSNFAIGDGKGHIGVGLGKANEVIVCIQKGKEIAKRNMFKVPLINSTLPHKIIGKHGASRVMLKPASPGTGIIAGGPVRAVMEQVGIQNILTKRYGSKNAMNLVYATLNGLLNLKDAVAIANRRQMTIKEVFN